MFDFYVHYINLDPNPNRARKSFPDPTEPRFDLQRSVLYTNPPKTCIYSTWRMYLKKYLYWFMLT
jgi:hypothetical protein